MANLRERIRKELKFQQSVEGFTPDIGLLFKVLGIVQTEQQWLMMVQVRYERYGCMLYQTHRFYYPSKLLLGLETLFSNQEDWQGG